MEQLNFTVGSSCAEAEWVSSHTSKRITLFVTSDDPNHYAIERVQSVSFFIGEVFGATATLPPFIHRYIV